MTEDRRFQHPQGVRWLWRRHVAQVLDEAARRAVNHNRLASNLTDEQLYQAFYPGGEGNFKDKIMEPSQALMGLTMLGYSINIAALNDHRGQHGISFKLEPVDQDGRDLLAIAHAVIRGKVQGELKDD